MPCVDESLFALGLSHTFLTSPVLFRLVKALGSAKAVWESSESTLERYLKPNQVQRLQETRANLDLQKQQALYQAATIEVIGFEDPRYPPLLKQTADPPFLLYVRGNPWAMHQKSLAIVGTRRLTDYGERVTHHLVDALSLQQPCIISGLAAGIDTLAHHAALHAGLPTVAVFGTPVDTIYPRTNEPLTQDIMARGGALVSEFPVGCFTDKSNFPKRNRIIAGLSLGTLVIEGDVKSGAMITAKCALEENRQVFAVPGNIFNPASAGPNKLIASGAVLVQCAQDICDALGWDTQTMLENTDESNPMNIPSQMLASLSPEERLLLNAIGYEPTPLEVIQQACEARSITQIQTSLTMLELQGLVRALPGAQFTRS